MTAHAGLRLVHRDAQVIPLPRRTRDIGDGARSLGLQRMLANATDDNDRGSLVVDPEDVADIHAGLAEHATFIQRRDALLALARRNTDWCGTPQGAVEVTAFLAFIAPACTRELWAEIVAELDMADDPLAADYDRAAAEHNLFVALDEALTATPGPGAA